MRHHLVFRSSCRRIASGWSVAEANHRARREAGVAATMTAAKYLKTRRNVPWLIGHSAERADEAISPSSTLKVICARSFVWEQALKLRKRVRERKFFSLKYVDNHDCSTLAQIHQAVHLIC